MVGTFSLKVNVINYLDEDFFVLELISEKLLLLFYIFFHNVLEKIFIELYTIFRNVHCQFKCPRWRNLTRSNYTTRNNSSVKISQLIFLRVIFNRRACYTVESAPIICRAKAHPWRALPSASKSRSFRVNTSRVTMSSVCRLAVLFFADEIVRARLCERERERGLSASPPLINHDKHFARHDSHGQRW